METRSDVRAQEAAQWAGQRLQINPPDLEPVSGDASFRRYFRIREGGHSLILMDAPPDKEDSRPFIDIASRLRDAGLRAPEIHHFDLHSGFGLIEDFGDTLYREVLTAENGVDLLPDLFNLLEKLARDVDTRGLPNYDSQRLQDELDLFTDWYLARDRQIRFSGRELETWQALCRTLLQSAESQPQVFVHRDFHSCNLLHTPLGPAVIDFQDGLRGPLSYDLVSLLWDRYIPWPRQQLEAWMTECHRRLQPGCSEAEWIRACDWMGLQRNLKIVGIFARLHYRDGKRGYRSMIPRFYGYVDDVLSRYPEFLAFRQLLEDTQCAP
jgi:aminoglycoside/choline kinase family phosphotransferase